MLVRERGRRRAGLNLPPACTSAATGCIAALDADKFPTSRVSLRGGAADAAIQNVIARSAADAAIQKFLSTLTLRCWIATPLARLAMTSQLISPADAITRHCRQL